MHMENAAPDLNYGPYIENEATQQFHDFDEELTTDDAQRLLRELGVSDEKYPLPNYELLELAWAYLCQLRYGKGPKIPWKWPSARPQLYA
jgi:hypothetical protein